MTDIKATSQVYPWISVSFKDAKVVDRLELTCQRCGAHGTTVIDGNNPDLSGLHAFESRHAMCQAPKKNDSKKLTSSSN